MSQVGIPLKQLRIMADGVYRGKKPLRWHRSYPRTGIIEKKFLYKDRDTQINWYTNPLFHQGNNIYHYERVPPNEIYRTIYNGDLERASYIPYIVSPSGERYWLLGSFHDFHEIKADFGGRCYEWDNRGGKKNIQRVPVNCATRELREETHGVLVRPVSQAVNEHRAAVFKGTNTEDDILKTVVFIMVDMTNHLGELDLLQANKKLIPMQRKIDSKISDMIGRGETPEEKFGPLGFYRESDILRGYDENGNPILTAFNLTDFIDNFNRLL